MRYRRDHARYSFPRKSDSCARALVKSNFVARASVFSLTLFFFFFLLSFLLPSRSSLCSRVRRYLPRDLHTYIPGRINKLLRERGVQAAQDSAWYLDLLLLRCWRSFSLFFFFLLRPRAVQRALFNASRLSSLHATIVARRIRAEKREEKNTRGGA